MSAVAWACFLLLGVGASCEDWMRRKVSNRVIAAGAIAGAVCYAVLAFNTVLGSYGLRFGGFGEFYLPGSFYRMAALHFVLSAVAGVVLWYLRIWPAGDAKLFIICSTLLALLDQNLRGFPTHLFLLALTNIFAAGALFVFAVVAFEWTRLAVSTRVGDGAVVLKSSLHRAWRRLQDELPRAHKYAIFAWNTFALFLVCRIVREFLGFQGSGLWQALAVYALLYAVWGRIQGYFLRWDSAGIAFFAVSALLIPFGVVRRWDVFEQLRHGGLLAVGFWFVLPATRAVIDSYLASSRTAPVAAGGLREGMILSDKSWTAIEGRRAAADEEEFAARYSDGLTDEEVRRLQSEAGSDVFEVHAPKPFAFWVFAGCLWTALSRTDVVEYVMRAFR